MFQFYKNFAENVQKLGDLDKRKARKGVDVSALQYLSIGCCVMEKVANGEYLENIVKNILLEQNSVNIISDDESPHKGDDLTGPEAWLDIYK